MRALISGLGSIGRRHGRNLAGLGIEIVGYDPDETRRREFADEVSGSRVVPSLASALEFGCDLAVIASPNRFHLDQALDCARAGVHLFVEKPLATGLDGVDCLSDAIARADLVLMMGSNWKFHPGPGRLKAIVDAGGLGRILAIQAIGGQYLPDWHPWEDYRRMYSAREDLGGGVLLDSHDVDYLSWLAGPVERVACYTARSGTLEIDTHDLACCWLVFAGGALGTLQLDYLQRPYARRVHITGTDGTAIWDFIAGTVRWYDAAAVEWSDDALPGDYDINQMYIDEMAHFLQCVETKASPVTPLSQATHVLAVLDAARRSSSLGGAPIPVTGQ